MKTIFETKVTHEGNSQGHLSSDDGTLDMEVRTADESQGKSGATFPEQLLAAGYAASFAAALELAAEEKDVEDTGDISVHVHLTGNIDDDELYLEVTIDSYIPGVDKDLGEELIDMAYEWCTFSKATRDNVTVHLNLLLD